jgi:hypothetical protein
MFLTITLLAAPATDLGYLLHKNPSRVHRFDLSFGKATVFHPETSSDRCTACLLVEVDPIGMVNCCQRRAASDLQCWSEVSSAASRSTDSDRVAEARGPGGAVAGANAFRRQQHAKRLDSAGAWRSGSESPGFWPTADA